MWIWKREGAAFKNTTKTYRIYGLYFVCDFISTFLSQAIFCLNLHNQWSLTYYRFITICCTFNRNFTCKCWQEWEEYKQLSLNLYLSILFFNCFSYCLYFLFIYSFICSLTIYSIISWVEVVVILFIIHFLCFWNAKFLKAWSCLLVPTMSP